MWRRSGLVSVQRIHPESGGQTLSDHPHAHPDKTGATGLTSASIRPADDQLWTNHLGVYFSAEGLDY